MLGLTRASKVFVSVVADAACAMAAWVLVVPDGRLSVGEWASGGGLASVLYCTSILGFGWRFGLYRAVLRFSGVRVLGAVGASYGFATVLIWLVDVWIGDNLALSQYLTLALIGASLSSGGRVLIRELIFRSARRQKTALVIYGAGDSGRQLLTAVSQSRTLIAVAMVDDSKGLQGTEFHGVRVYDPGALHALCEQYPVELVVLAIPSLSRQRRAEILQSLEGLPVKVRSMPRISDILSGRKSMLDLQEVPIDELLGRDPVAPLRAIMGRAVTGRVVCVTGAGGSIGHELVRQLIKLQPTKIVLVELNEFALYESVQLAEAHAKPLDVLIVPVLQSVTDRQMMTHVLAVHGVQLLFHAAAYKHVPLVEMNPFAGVMNNVFGTQATLDAALDAGVQSVVLISTDKAVRPTNVMGASKRLAELIAQAYSGTASGHGVASVRNTVISMVRFGNVLSSSGSVIPRFKAQILEGGPVTVTHPEITRYFMTIPEAVELVIQTSGMAHAGDVFLLDMGSPVKILDLAKRMVRLSGYRPQVVGDNGNPSDLPQPEPPGDSMSIPIVFTGLRPGEKLYEELLIDATAYPTEHPMIYRASEVSMPLSALAPLLERLRTACIQRDLSSLKQTLIDAGIGYQPDSLGAQAGVESEASVCVTPVYSDLGVGTTSPASPLISAVTPRPINPLLSRALHLFFLLTRPLTMGARAIVVNAANEVLLVRHRYEDGWQLPGGGVEKGESAIEALKREVREEAGVVILGNPVLVGSFHNRSVSGRDHVLVYRCDEFERRQDEPLSGEIADHGFFPLNELPEGTTLGTRRRLSECFEGLEVQECW